MSDYVEHLITQAGGSDGYEPIPRQMELFTLECPECWLEKGHMFNCPRRHKTDRERKCS